MTFMVYQGDSKFKGFITGYWLTWLFIHTALKYMTSVLLFTYAGTRKGKNQARGS